LQPDFQHAFCDTRAAPRVSISKRAIETPLFSRGDFFLLDENKIKIFKQRNILLAILFTELGRFFCVCFINFVF